MIKLQFDAKSPVEEGATNITWVSKRKVTSPDNGNVIGLRFHKISPRIKETFYRDLGLEDGLR